MNFKKSNEHGFTLVELMIVVAIIGILAAIAIPQFAAYRTRSMNANAKALNKMVVSSEADLNAELGCFGETENQAAGNTLIQLVGAPGAGAIMDSVAVPEYAVPASATTAGGRLSGNNDGTGKTFSVPLGIGANMVALANTPTAVAGTNQATSHTIFTKHWQGDTVYGSDSDSPNNLYSVSHAGWVGNTTNNRLQAATAAAVTSAVTFDADLDPATADVAGAGAPTPNWAIVQ